MADIKITQLPVITTKAPADLVMIVGDTGTNPTNKAITAENLLKAGVYEVTLSADGEVPFISPFMVCFIDPTADINITFDDDFPIGSVIFICNIGPYAIVADPAGLAQAMGSGAKEYFMRSSVGWV